jgi:hypothetical protein
VPAITPRPLRTPRAARDGKKHTLVYVSVL